MPGPKILNFKYIAPEHACIKDSKHTSMILSEAADIELFR